MGSGVLRKGGRRKGGMMQEGRGGYACFEGVVHAGVPCVGVPVDVLVWGKWLL
ncbi:MULTISPECIES: hypothetical protein [unclassified Bartonella]|uniref:hypothetical protein n=1 Tax=unclassified Bartonella TaxID=2645622 RepID=UPI0035CEB23E